MIACSPSKPFIASGLTADPAYVFALQSSPLLVDLDADGENLAILCNGSDVFALYRRAVGPMQAWERFVQWLPSASREAAVLAAREMDQWMVQHRSAANIVDRIPLGNDTGRAFLEDVGAQLVGQDDHEAIYLTTGAVH